jgi:putative phosphoesterase
MPRGVRRLPEECLRQLEAADLILHAGDFVSAEFYRELGRLGRLEAVHGNMDDDRLQRMLPAKRVIEVGEARVGMVHEPAGISGFDDCDAIVFGHTHMPTISRQGETWLLNPGSPTERRRAKSHSMLVLRIDGKRLKPKLLRLT